MIRILHVYKYNRYTYQRIFYAGNIKLKYSIKVNCRQLFWRLNGKLSCYDFVYKTNTLEMLQLRSYYGQFMQQGLLGSLHWGLAQVCTGRRRLCIHTVVSKLDSIYRRCNNLRTYILTTKWLHFNLKHSILCLFIEYEMWRNFKLR